jgi:hypothetical protein
VVEGLMEVQVLSQLAGTGVVGVLLVLSLLALRHKDRELKNEQQARIEDAKAYLNLAMSLQSQVIVAVNKLSEIVDAWERRDEERERVAVEASAKRAR